MNIADSFLKAQLQDVFWIGGGAYGGKTTITDLLADRHGFVPYHSEDHFHEHKKAASPEDHPALLAPFHGWEWFFNRPIDEYIQAIEDRGREQFEMVLLDLIKMAADSKVVAADEEPAISPGVSSLFSVSSLSREIPRRSTCLDGGVV